MYRPLWLPALWKAGGPDYDDADYSFMSCSARLPVYILLVSAFFPVNQGLILLSVYLIGILLAIGTSFVEEDPVRQIFGSFCHGIASLPDAYDAKYHDPYVGKKPDNI